MLNDKNLSDLMKKKGVTNRELALHIGVAPSSMTFYRQGLRIPSAITLGRMANFLGCKMDDIWII